MIHIPKLSELIAKAEAWASEKISNRFPKLKERWKIYLPLFLCGLYFYGMILNSIRLGIVSTMGDENIESIWVVNPFSNLFAIFTPTGLVITAAGCTASSARRVAYGSAGLSYFAELVKQWERGKLPFAKVFEQTGLKESKFYRRLRELQA